MTSACVEAGIGVFSVADRRMTSQRRFRRKVLLGFEAARWRDGTTVSLADEEKSPEMMERETLETKNISESFPPSLRLRAKRCQCAKLRAT